MSKRNTKNQYLMARRLTCQCGHAMTSVTFNQERNGKAYQYHYYRCNASQDRYGYPDSGCPGKYFSVKAVDNVVWEWLAGMIKDRKKLEEGLRGYQEEMAQMINPLQQELTIVDDLIRRHTADLEDALANLKLVKGERAKAVIANDLQRAEKALDSLEAKRAELTEQIERETLTDDQISEIQEFIAQMVDDWEVISQDFEACRALVDMLGVTGTIKIEDGIRKIYVKAKIGGGPTPLLLSERGRNRYAASLGSLPAILISGVYVLDEEGAF